MVWQWLGLWAGRRLANRAAELRGWGLAGDRDHKSTRKEQTQEQKGNHEPVGQRRQSKKREGLQRLYKCGLVQERVGVGCCVNLHIALKSWSFPEVFSGYQWPVTK